MIYVGNRVSLPGQTDGSYKHVWGTTGSVVSIIGGTKAKVKIDEKYLTPEFIKNFRNSTAYKDDHDYSYVCYIRRLELIQEPEPEPAPDLIDLILNGGVCVPVACEVEVDEVITKQEIEFLIHEDIF